jgi:Protein of unknown function (DUF2958)
VKLLTKAIRAKLPPLRSTCGVPLDRQRCVVKFFTPWSNWTWYACEGEVRPDGDVEFFGRVDGLESEWGYFTLRELESIRGPFGLRVERDLHFTDRTIPQSEGRAG